MLIAFAAGVAALLGAAVAWAAACAGGRDRDGTTPRTVLSEWWHRPFSLRTWTTALSRIGACNAQIGTPDLFNAAPLCAEFKSNWFHAEGFGKLRRNADPDLREAMSMTKKMAAA